MAHNLKPYSTAARFESVSEDFGTLFIRFWCFQKWNIELKWVKALILI